MRSALLLAALTCGCAAPLPLMVFDQHHDDALAELPVEVLEACEVLQVECEPVGSDEGSYGVAVLALVDDLAPGLDGTTLTDGACRNVALALAESLPIAHELGHLFGLGHVDEPGNLMANPFALAGDELTDKQRARLHRRIGRLIGGCP